MWEIWTSVCLFPAVAMADRLHLFSYIAQHNAATREEIIAHLDIKRPAAEAILGILMAINPPLLQTDEGKIVLTDVARNFLLPEEPFYYGKCFKFVWDMPMTAASLWQKIQLEDVQDERAERGNASEAQKISTHWVSGQISHRQAERLTGMMHSHSVDCAYALAREKQWFTGIRHLLDVGGGSACFSIALAEQFPELACTVMDLPEVCEVAQHYIARSPVAERVSIYAANMFTDPWPRGADAIFFANIFHDWNQEQCLFLAQQSYQLLAPGGRIYLHEMLWDDEKKGPLVTALFSLYMVQVTEGGRQFSARELRELLSAAGFVDITIHSSTAYYSLVCAKKEE
jgi:SAM-dependent methyltransferase